MKRHWSLATKLILLVSIPIALQVFMLFKLVEIHDQAEQQLRLVTNAQKVVTLLNETNKDVYELLYYISARHFQFTDLSELLKIKQIAARTDQHLLQLKQCDPNDREIQRDVEQARDLKRRATRLLVQATGAYTGADGGQQERERLKNEVNAILFEAMTDLLPRISEKQTLLGNVVPSANQRSEQDKAILFMAFTEFILSIGAAYLIARGVVRRVARLNDNTYRVAAKLPLNIPDAGTDEIAELDRTLHRLSSALQTVSGRETLLVENAFDAIITLDKSGRIINLNQAGAGLLGYDADEILGTPIAHYVVPTRQQEFREHLSSLKEVASGETLELQLQHSSGQILEATCSIKWFVPENCFFCIMHDVTAQLTALRLKNEIVEMVSHDLKTPLSTVDYILGVFAENAAVLEIIESDLSVARRNVKRIIQLVVDFLDAEKIESKMYKLLLEKVSINEIFNATFESCKGGADQKNVVLEFKPSADFVRADFSALTRVMTNLVTNAINYSDRNSKVQIGFERASSLLKVTVSDNGPGLTAELATKIFDRFYQAPGSKAARSSGLGLTICKLLVELGGGTIGVESEPLHGSTFYFTVPLFE